VERCLQQNPALRWQNVGQLKAELHAAAADWVSGGIPSNNRLRFVYRTGLLSAGALLASALIFWKWGPTQHELAFGHASPVRLMLSDQVVTGAISPDGRHVAYVADITGGRTIRVQNIATQSIVQLTSPGKLNYSWLGFSPDGDHVYYLTRTGSLGTVFRVPMLGGSPTLVVADVDSPITFSPDGKQLAFIRGRPERRDTA
jgi:hypothetical protein